MKTEAFPKSGNSSIEQRNFPMFGFVYLTLTVFIQFVWGGLKAAKVLLMVDELEFTENEAIIIIHLQSSLMDLAMCIGYILATLYCGPYITCLIQELLKLLLTCPMCTLATMGILELKDRRRMYLYGQILGVLTSFGNSCLTSFLSEQFNIDNYFKFNRLQLVINLACSALGIFTAPHLIQYYQCFWTDTCYSMVWLCEWALCIINFLIFLIFCTKVERRKPKYSVNCMLIKLARDASSNKQKERRKNKREPVKPLLEYSNMYSPEFRKDAQKILCMWTFYFPLAGYWALHSQQSTTWILQAKNLDGNLFDWSIVLPNELWGIIPLSAVALRMLFLTLMDDTKYPLRLAVLSQLIMGFAFMLAAILEKYIMNKEEKELHMVWALPQLLLVSISDVIFIAAYRKFIIREVPPNFRGVTQTLFVLSRCFGNIIVVILNFMEMMTGFPNRLAQFIIYASILNLFLIMFTVLNRKFERLLQGDKEYESGPSKSR